MTPIERFVAARDGLLLQTLWVILLAAMLVGPRSDEPITSRSLVVIWVAYKACQWERDQSD